VVRGLRVVDRVQGFHPVDRQRRLGHVDRQHRLDRLHLVHRLGRFSGLSHVVTIPLVPDVTPFPARRDVQPAIELTRNEPLDGSELGRSERRVGELVQLVGKPQNLVSYPLAELRRAGIVSAKRSSADGRDVYYQAYPTFHRVADELDRRIALLLADPATPQLERTFHA